MGDHLVNGKFQSDKSPSCPPDKVPLSVNDKTAQDLLWEYAQRRRKVDAGFSADLETRLRDVGFTPAQRLGEDHARIIYPYLRQAVTTAFLAGVEHGVGWLEEAPESETEAKMCADRATAELEALSGGLPTTAAQGDGNACPVLSTEDREALLVLRRLVATTAKCCNQRQEYDVQLALLDRLLQTPSNV